MTRVAVYLWAVIKQYNAHAEWYTTLTAKRLSLRMVSYVRCVVSKEALLWVALYYIARGFACEVPECTNWRDIRVPSSEWNSNVTQMNYMIVIYTFVFFLVFYLLEPWSKGFFSAGGTINFNPVSFATPPMYLHHRQWSEFPSQEYLRFSYDVAKRIDYIPAPAQVPRYLRCALTKS